MLELLAPAKNFECAKAAIDFGADAIYMGANRFGARQNAANTLEEIKKTIDYAHQFYVRVYVTLNTLLKDDELKDALELASQLCELGADALIIQDMGILEALCGFANAFKGDCSIKLPPIPLFASTQCHNNTPEKVKFLEDAGFSRVILARELSLEQIREIKNRTNIELETFVHGALCVSYSGMCYLSEYIGGRSANRGECAQPCRKKYTLIDDSGKIIAKDKYLLSLKDFNASKHLKNLIDAGVTSFKIEGRLKDENYIKNVVGYYRRLLDRLSSKKASTRVDFDLVCDPQKSFNRGFSDYFLQGRKNNIWNFDTNKSIGEKIGTVTKISRNCFEYKGKKLNKQDGICWFKNGILKGCLVNNVIANKVFTACFDADEGTEIYRNQDFEFEKKLKNSKTKRRIPAEIKIDGERISASDYDGNSVSMPLGEYEAARNPQKALETLKTQLSKAGESIFSIEQIEITGFAGEIPFGCESFEFETEASNSSKTSYTVPFIPVSKINEIRRALLEKLLKERVKNYKRKTVIHKNTSHPYPEKTFVHVSNAAAQTFCTRHGTTQKTPEALMTCKHCLKYAFNMCKSPKKLFLIDEKGVKYPLFFDCTKCEMQVLKPAE